VGVAIEGVGLTLSELCKWWEWLVVLKNKWWVWLVAGGE
jgi:hypothetical protein